MVLRLLIVLRAPDLVLPMCEVAVRAMTTWLPRLEKVAELGFQEVGVTELVWRLEE